MANNGRNVMDFRQRADDFAQDAERLGLKDDFLFGSTLERYVVQVEILHRLKKELEAAAPTVEKRYGGADNLYANPLWGEFNKTASAANQTCGLLAKLIAAAEKRAADSDYEDCEL